MRRPARIVALFLAVVVLALGVVVWDQGRREAGTPAPTGTTSTETGTDPYGGLK